MRRDNQRQPLVLCAFGIFPVIWLGLLIAPAISAERAQLPSMLIAALNNPLAITWCESCLKTVFILLMVYAIGIGVYLSTRRNTRPKEEHGSAKWGDAKVISRKYADRRFTENKILTQNVRIGFNAHKHRRNLNILVVGGSGAGKTRFYAKPNAMQTNSSMVILDPKGGATRS